MTLATNRKKKIILMTTGGTIEKTYDEYNGKLRNKRSVIKEVITERLRLPYTQLEVYCILAKDSLDITDEDRALIVEKLKKHSKSKHPIVIFHGTDTLAVTAAYCKEKIKRPRVPIIFTGAMKPFGFRDTDASQNYTEALLAAKLLPPGIYVSFHNRIFEVPNVRKNRKKSTFEST